MKARYPGQCRCGAGVLKGYEIRFKQSDDTGRWEISECPACSDTLSSGRVDLSSQQRVTSIAEAMRNRERRRQRKLAKERVDG